ncbi:Heterokaryon incompatibility [Ophiocordyceps camponoti-floridani]|uniref:Heterokaryon incompatibility n=1 Tax=Ophiocordyceps camponoti-floridani TaxID=2030778 RepID=A0A8H4QCK5_9HYPO|nr:Heterokaryon incompatibility [Ophiocordyceps camponoti-floridani]
MRRKLSRMLLLPARRPESEPVSGRRSSATAQPELHQLPPRPSISGGATQELGCIDSAAEEYRLCARCAALDLGRMLDWKSGQPRAWIALSHVLQQADSACPYCVFFRAMLGPEAAAAGLGDKFTPYLRIRLAFERLPGIGERHELAKSVLAEVVSRNRSLPRGFIVKADSDDDDDDKPQLRGRLVPRMLDVGLPRRWLDHCRDAHVATCRRPADTLVPGLRVIDCMERRIVFCADEFEYVTLSYVCEGNNNSNDCQDDGCTLPDTMSTVFTDAMTLTLSIGLRYLWIDRFCLMPLPADERRRQTAMMDDILHGAALTVVAASGSGEGDGLAGVSVPRHPQLSLKTETGLFTTTLLRPNLETASSSWAGCARTLQDGLLSRRRLVLGPSQAYFQCQAMHCVESVALPLGLAPGVDLGRVFADQNHPRRRPGAQIGAFMARRPARLDDRLDAFAGVLRAWARADDGPVHHLVGLPLFHPDSFVDVAVVSQTDRLAVGLGWMPDRAASTTGVSWSSCRLLLDGDSPAFPSWTWLAWTLDDGRHFHFNLAETGSIIDGVCAPPGMEISVGFSTGAVLSWEIDGDALGRRPEPVRFLRLHTFCADLSLAPDLSLDRQQEPGLTPQARLAIESWALAASPPTDGSRRLVLVLLSGRGWRFGGAATALVCRHAGWHPGRPLVRLGVVPVEHRGLVVAEGSAGVVLLGMGGG